MEISTISDQITTTSLLSIKKEIVDFEPTATATSQSPVLIESTEIVAEITAKTTSSINQNNVETQVEQKITQALDTFSNEQSIVKTEEPTTNSTNKKSNKNAKNNFSKAIRSSSRKESQMDLSEPTSVTPSAVAVSSPTCSKDEIHVENKSENVKPAQVKNDTCINSKNKIEEIESNFYSFFLLII
jgi:hypothetical protein